MSPSAVIATTAHAPGWRTISQSPVGQVSISRRRYLPWKPSRDAAGAGRSSGGDDDGLLRSRSPERRGRTDELPEQRVRTRRPGTELRVELSRDEEGMVRKLDDLHEAPVLRLARHDQAAALERLLVERVDLESVAVPFVDDRLTVGLRGSRSGDEMARLRPEPHRGPHVRHVLLLREEVDHRVRRRRIELRGVRALQPTHVASELHDGALEAEADAEERHPLFPRVADRLDLALDAPDAEAAGNKHAVDAREDLLGAPRRELVGSDPPKVHGGAVGEPAVRERLH